MRQKHWMIYGANGYTGELIARQAVKEGLRPTLAARRAEAVRPLAEELGLSWTSFPLQDPARVVSEIRGFDAVLHCAGPFGHTSRVVVEACLKNRAHYLDITGEIGVLEWVLSRHQEAVKAKVALLPGVGFDVVPSDCLAAELSSRMPDAVNLELALAGSTHVSPGTLRTMIENLPNGGTVRRDGKIVQVPTGRLSKVIRIHEKKHWATSIAWGDVSTAFHSTGIPNITVFGTMSRPVGVATRVTGMLSPLLARPRVQRFLKKQIERHVRGPSEEERKTTRMTVWGQVNDAAGGKLTGEIELPEGYAFTAVSALEATKRVLRGEVKPGAWTPSKAFGRDFVTWLPGTKMTIGISG